MLCKNWTLLLLLVIVLCEKAFAVDTTTATPSNTSDEDDDEDWEDEAESSETSTGKQYKNPRNSPSTLCPRDEEQATLLGQKCLRKCSSDEDCKSKKKKCLCDGACGMSCIKPDRECPEPEQISFGGVTASGRLFGARITYTCQHGYHVVGLQSRTCQGDGQWAGTAPACKQNIYCLSPPTIDHARHNALPEQTTFDLDSTLQYYCHTGYVTNGFPRAKCLAIDGQASWYGPDISCEPRSCGAPPVISHGWHAGECYTFGCRINYHCADGFELVGKAERFCQADGTWMPKELPTCVLKGMFCWSFPCVVVTAVQCPPPENPRHGKAIYTSCSYNSVVSYECKYGYTLIGETTRRCGADKKWSGQQPSCKEINCGHPGRLWNGWLENIEGGTGLGASIIFRCHDGMTLEGNTSTVCQIDGKWRYPLPKCLAPCVVPQVAQGRVILVAQNDTAMSSTVVTHGEALAVECNYQYEFLASLSPVTCNNGTWTHIPKCQPARCKHLPKNPKHGMVIAPKIDHGMKAKFTCKDGFELKGNQFIECSFGNWTGEVPICQEVYCPFPGFVENGKILLVGNMGLYDYRPYVRKVTNNKQIMYDCDKGYILNEGPPGATCIGGKWSPTQLPKCVLGQHPRLRWSRKRRSIIVERYKRAFIRYNKQFYEKPYKFSIPSYLDELFDVSKDIKKRRKRALKGSSSSSKLSVITHKGSGSSTNVRRGGNKKPDENDIIFGTTSPSPFNKKNKHRVPCDPLSDEYVNIEVVKHGKDKNSTHSSGTVIRLTCLKGYLSNMPKNKTAKCVRGNWKPHKPECSPPPCILPQIQNGQYLSGYRAGLTIANGSSVNYQCDNGFRKSTAKQIECILGQLFPRGPSCTAHLELPPSSSSSVNTSPSTNIFDSPRYLGGGDIVRGGDIAQIEFGGSMKTCAPPAKVQGSLVYRNGEPLVDHDQTFPEGTEVTFNCIETIMGEKTTWKIICEDGSWIGKSLNCDLDELLTLKSHSNSTCIFRNQEINVISFYNDQEIKEDIVEFPSGAHLVSRCIDIGKYTMTGPNERRCMGGDWDGPKPSCFGLNQENDYSMEKPPTILFRHQLGPIAQTNDGKLMVYPGTVLHMECLWMKRFGNPNWTVSHDYRKYPQGWTADPGRDSQLEYRLSILHASKDDSGIFTCETPARHTHSVEIIVRAVHCPVIPQRRGLSVNTQSTKMNTRLKFTCVNGNALIGTAEVACLPSGNWSAPFPVCEKVQCDQPGSPENGYIQGTGPYKAGDVVQFNCNTDYMMEGQPIIACQDNGRWSGPLPKCVQACSYPGTTISGRMSSVKFYYKIGENITFTCDEGLSLKGAAMLKCLKNGKWSNAIPTCVPEDAANSTLMY
ncbi:sushi, von Willebrand factor type A, EGF and pentraxin domain-containing protein 1 isoform X3 [Onthophagus taurus]|uniref:sushi, von Willebrand factor type A, EGF and pentraxin domain-containing protein 1 isoform X3 n=1 Tax=Onthophagus taurus TaxID=166361 RepID=UPI0039BDB55F